MYIWILDLSIYVFPILKSVHYCDIFLENKKKTLIYLSYSINLYLKYEYTCFHNISLSSDFHHIASEAISSSLSILQPNHISPFNTLGARATNAANALRLFRKNSICQRQRQFSVCLKKCVAFSLQFWLNIFVNSPCFLLLRCFCCCSCCVFPLLDSFFLCKWLSRSN